MDKVGIVIVTYNSASVIGPCLDSCLRQEGAEVLVIDNASTDSTLCEVARRPAARYIANSTNVGFAAAVNQGFAAIDAEFILILNPDTVLTTSLEPLVAACREPGIGAACGVLVNSSLEPQFGFAVRRFPDACTLAFEVLGWNRLFPGNAVNRRYRCLDLDLRADMDVEQPAGACLMVRKDAWKAVGGLDESFYPVWFEDVDFCRRLHGHGYRIRLVSSVPVLHLGGHSVNKIAPRSRSACWYGSLLRYAAKHFRQWELRTLCAVVMLASVPRAVIALRRERSVEPVQAFFEVIRLAGLCLLSGRRLLERTNSNGAVRKQTHQYANTTSSTGS
jgi:Predicted glycosyltransferases